MSALDTTLAELAKAREKSPKALVAYSDGKDSRVVMDLALRTFDEVEAFFMYLIPGLECIEVAMEAARKRWGVKIRQYPHWIAGLYMKEGLFCPVPVRRTSLPKWSLMDVYHLAMHEAGCRMIVTGAKKSDSISRARLLKRGLNKPFLSHPIVAWRKADVVGYLTQHKIELPASSGRRTTGIDLNEGDLLFLHDTYPDDFKRLCNYFPYAEAVVWKRKFYGQG